MSKQKFTGIAGVALHTERQLDMLIEHEHHHAEAASNGYLTREERDNVVLRNLARQVLTLAYHLQEAVRVKPNLIEAEKEARWENFARDVGTDEVLRRFAIEYFANGELRPEPLTVNTGGDKQDEHLNQASWQKLISDHMENVDSDSYNWIKPNTGEDKHET